MSKTPKPGMLGLQWMRSVPRQVAQPGSRGAWLMLGGAFAAVTVSAGIMHSYAVFLLAFLEEFRLSRAETSGSYSVSPLAAGGSSPLGCAPVDRLRPRP